MRAAAFAATALLDNVSKYTACNKPSGFITPDRALRQLWLHEGGSRSRVWRSSKLRPQVISLNGSVVIEGIVVIFSRVKVMLLSVQIFCCCHGIQGRQTGCVYFYLQYELGVGSGLLHADYHLRLVLFTSWRWNMQHVSQHNLHAIQHKELQVSEIPEEGNDWKRLRSAQQGCFPYSHLFEH